MINQQQLTRRVTEFKREGNLSMSAMKAGMDPKTARKYVKSGVVVLAAHGPRMWRTRTDLLGAAWALAEVYLRAAPELEATALFEHLLETAGEALLEGQLRTFQRRVRQWRLEHGPDPEVIFAQEHPPGEVMQVDRTHAKELAVTIAGQPLPPPCQPVPNAFYTIQAIPTLGGNNSTATGINSSGQVVGSSLLAGNAASHAFLYSNGTMTDLGTLGGSLSQASGINNSSQVVGTSYGAPDGSYRPFLYRNGMLTDLGTLGGSDTFGRGINDSSQVVGSSEVMVGMSGHAFRYSNGRMTDLGTLGGAESYAIGINPNGQVVGASGVSGNATSHAFLYSNGTMTDLGTLGGNSSGTLQGSHSVATGINNSGQVVGNSYLANGSPRAFLYSNGTMVDLNTRIPSNPGLPVATAIGINDCGVIVGSDALGNSFLLTPIQP